MKPKRIDTHTHVNFEKFATDAADVIDRSLASGTWMVNVGSQLQTSQRAVELARNYAEGVYAGVGMHPTHVHELSFDEPTFGRLAEDKACVAVGETGLDYYRLPEDSSTHPESIAMQKEVLRAHLRIAEAVDKPLIVHCRDAYVDLFEELKRHAGKVKRRGVCHCFVSDLATAEQFLELGFLVSFTGIITFTDDQKLLEAVQKLPLDRMMIETDAPYLTPMPFRGKRNEPLYVKHVAEKIAELRGLSLEEVSRQTTATARTLFRI